MIDVNSRIMADMKSGSSNIEQAVTTAIEYVKLGYNKVVSASEISTNSRSLNSDEKQLLLDRINEELNYRGIDLQILSGNLMKCDSNMINFLDNDLISSINYSRYILLELPSTTECKDLNRYIYEIQIRGYVPIIVHPEKYRYVQENTDYLLSLKERDCLIQINISSLSKGKNNQTYKCAKELLNRKMVDLVATESENAYDEITQVRDNIKTLHKLIDYDYYDVIMSLNPKLVIENERIDRIQALPKNGGGLLSKIFGRRR